MRWKPKEVVGAVLAYGIGAGFGGVNAWWAYGRAMRLGGGSKGTLPAFALHAGIALTGLAPLATLPHVISARRLPRWARACILAIELVGFSLALFGLGLAACRGVNPRGFVSESPGVIGCG